MHVNDFIEQCDLARGRLLPQPKPSAEAWTVARSSSVVNRGLMASAYCLRVACGDKLANRWVTDEFDGNRVGDAKSRLRRIMIVALARKLVVALSGDQVPTAGVGPHRLGDVLDSLRVYWLEVK